jgi:hypothetical protein
MCAIKGINIHADNANASKQALTTYGTKSSILCMHEAASAIPS